MAANWPAIASAASHAVTAAAAQGVVPFRALAPDEATELDAMAARILPSDDGPGASEAGVIHFIDRALETFARDQRPLGTSGLEELRTAVAARYPGSRFSALSATALGTARPSGHIQGARERRPPLPVLSGPNGRTSQGRRRAQGVDLPARHLLSCGAPSRDLPDGDRSLPFGGRPVAPEPRRSQSLSGR